MDFKRLKLIQPLIDAVDKKGYAEPTPIQAAAIPALLEGRDIMGIAQTGTGKTAAFLLPILQHIKNKIVVPPRLAPRALILAPTRELAAQIDANCKEYSRYLKITHTVIFGGVSQKPQVRAIYRGVDILVATPGRLLDLVGQKRLRLDYIEIFVLDEADRMLDMGFIHDVKKIIKELPEKRQTMCFSATMSKDVEKLARTMLSDPVHVAVAPQATTVEQVDQCVLFVDSKDKDAVMIDLLKQEHLEKVLVFTRTKHRANKLAHKLSDQGISAGAIHGNKSQNQRTKALEGFREGRVRVLVATDIAARGIDVDSISHVINYDLPNQPESYVHRIGRTARAGAEGTAYSFCAADERGYLYDIEKAIKVKLKVIDHPRHSKAAQDSTGPESRSSHNKKPRFRRSKRPSGKGARRRHDVSRMNKKQGGAAGSKDRGTKKVAKTAGNRQKKFNKNKGKVWRQNR